MNENPTPVISPVLALLKSRKTMVAFVTALLNIAVAFVPGLEAHRADLLTISLILTTLMASVLVASIAHEDASKATTTSTATVTTTGGGEASASISSPEGAPSISETYIAPGYPPRRPLN